MDPTLSARRGATGDGGQLISRPALFEQVAVFSDEVFRIITCECACQKAARCKQSRQMTPFDSSCWGLLRADRGMVSPSCSRDVCACGHHSRLAIRLVLFDGGGVCWEKGIYNRSSLSLFYNIFCISRMLYGRAPEAYTTPDARLAKT